MNHQKIADAAQRCMRFSKERMELFELTTPVGGLCMSPLGKRFVFNRIELLGYEIRKNEAHLRNLISESEQQR